MVALSLTIMAIGNLCLFTAACGANGKFAGTGVALFAAGAAGLAFGA